MGLTTRNTAGLVPLHRALTGTWGGVGIATLLVAILVGTTWWTVRTERAAHRVTARTAFEAEQRAVGETVRSLLALETLQPAHQYLEGLVGMKRLSAARVHDPSGSVIIDAAMGRPAIEALPKSWSDRPSLPRQGAVSDDLIRRSQLIDIPGRGALRLDVESQVSAPSGFGAANVTWLGIPALLALGVVIVTLQRHHAGLRPLAAIHRTLAAFADGETSSTALTIDTSMGREAEAWNQLITDREHANQRQIRERADELTLHRVDAGSDLGSAMAALWHGVLVIDETEHITFANHASTVYLKTPDPVVGTAYTTIIDDEAVREQIAKAQRGMTRHWSATEIGAVDEGGVLRYYVRSMGEGAGSTVVLLIEDVTQQRVAEQSRNAFVDQVTHELRTPLTNIRLYAEQAIEEGEQDPAIRSRSLNVINTEALRLERIVADMLSVAEIEAGTYSARRDDVRLATMVEELRHDFEALAREKSITLDFDVPPKLPVIQADRDKLSLAIQNLIGNALKYTPTGGRVVVRTVVEDNQILFEVVDNGIGIPTDDLDRVFDKFYRVKDARSESVTGTGLGLAISREVIRLHGGDITVQSEPDKGSTFQLTLPTPGQAAAA